MVDGFRSKPLKWWREEIPARYGQKTHRKWEEEKDVKQVGFHRLPRRKFVIQLVSIKLDHGELQLTISYC